MDPKSLAIGFFLGAATALWVVGRLLDPIIGWLADRKEAKNGVDRV